MKKLILSLFWFLFSVTVFSQNHWNGKQLVLQNEAISRIIVLENGEFSTMSYRLKDYPFNFVRIQEDEPTVPGQKPAATPGDYEWYRGIKPDEFSFLLNDKKVTGKTGWEVVNFQENKDGQVAESKITLHGTSEMNRNLELKISYLVYPNLPIIRKKIDFKNMGSDVLKIESLDVESLNIPWGNIHNMVYHDYARNKNIGPYLGNWHDPLIICHNMNSHHGIVIGNEAPGVLKRVSVCVDGWTINAGLTHTDQDYAFRKWLKPGELWESTWIFTGLYAEHNPREFVDGPVSDFVRKYMGIRLAKIPRRPAFVYNTWQPFRRDVNEKLIMELADAASACGVEEFIIDDGWQVGFGDWEIDYNKFPNGLKPVFDYY